MRRLGISWRTRPTLLYVVIAVLIMPLLLAFVSGASSSAKTAAVIFLAVGVSVLLRAYRAGDNQ